MAVDKAALREGTRWVLYGRKVEVYEITSRSVIYGGCEGDPSDDRAIGVERFIADAHDPATADFESLVKDIRRHSDAPGRNVNTDADLRIMVCLLRDAVVHLMDRLGPPVPTNVAPAVPRQNPAPVVVEEPPVVEPYPEGDYAIAMPAAPECEPLRPVTFDKPSLRKGKSWAA